MLNKKGFTLVELLIVVIIIGILATLAVPQYARMMEKAKQAEARRILGSIRTAQELYKMEHANSNYAIDVGNLAVHAPGAGENDFYFIYTLAGANGTVWNAVATRKVVGPSKIKYDGNAYNVVLEHDGDWKFEGPY